MVDCDGGIDAATFAEEGADGAAGALRGDEDYVDVGGDVDTGFGFEDGGEAVGEVEGLRYGVLVGWLSLGVLSLIERH